MSCPSCNARYQYDEARFADSAIRKLKCTKCGSIFEVQRPGPASPDSQPTSFILQRRGEEGTKQFDMEKVKAAMGSPELPQLAPLSPHRRYSLAVILGANAGQIHQLAKPRIVLGRGAGSDLQLQDSEVSRRHAMLEIHGDEATISDLASTNGTYVDGVRVEKATISSNQEFSLGTTTLMFIVTDVHDAATG